MASFIVYIENLKQSTKNSRTNTNKQLQHGCRIKKKSITILNKKGEFEIKNTIEFTLAPQK